MPKDPRPAPSDLMAWYDKLVATQPAVDRKGATVPYTAVNGNMFSYLAKSGILALRLPEGEREAFIKKYRTKLCEQYGVVQKEYVEIPADLLAKTPELKKFFALSFAYASELKPKATTQKKKRQSPSPAAKA